MFNLNEAPLLLPRLEIICQLKSTQTVLTGALYHREPGDLQASGIKSDGVS